MLIRGLDTHATSAHHPLWTSHRQALQAVWFNKVGVLFLPLQLFLHSINNTTAALKIKLLGGALRHAAVPGLTCASPFFPPCRPSCNSMHSTLAAIYRYVARDRVRKNGFSHHGPVRPSSKKQLSTSPFFRFSSAHVCLLLRETVRGSSLLLLLFPVVNSETVNLHQAYVRSNSLAHTAAGPRPSALASDHHFCTLSLPTPILYWVYPCQGRQL